MKVANIAIKGGLGNQLFQYALGIYLKEKYACNVHFDIRPLYSKQENLTPRTFELKKLFPEMQFCSDFTNQLVHTCEDNIFARLFKKMTRELVGLNYMSEDQFNHSQSLDKKRYYFDGYWQDLRYAKCLLDELNKIAFNQLKDSHYYKEILQSDNNIGIHIRRGDYVSNPFINSYHGNCDLNYYQKALDYIQSKTASQRTFIFTDDVHWANENFGNNSAVSIVSQNVNNAITELFLLKSCSHLVLSNSSFSAWASYLNGNNEAIIIAPEQWTKAHKTVDLSIKKENWIVL
ncbi:MAG: alpha-1,2-fucosyltransferase [Bacteroidia bacterium]